MAAGLSLTARWQYVHEDGGKGAKESEARREDEEPVRGSLRRLEDRVRKLEKKQAQRRIRVELPRK